MSDERDFIIPRCRHGNIILGCPHDNCKEQNDHLKQSRAAMDAYEKQGQDAARKLVREYFGLPI